VAGAGQTFSTDVADHAIGLLIDVLRRVSAADRYVRRGMWPVQGDYPLGSKVCQFISLLKTVTDTYKFTIFSHFGPNCENKIRNPFKITRDLSTI
jgi:hypothetical protein